MTPERYAKIRRALAARQPDLTILHEDLHKTLNLAAIARTCETVGVETIHAVANYRGNPLAGRGANRWVTRVGHASIEAAAATLRGQGFHILATHLAHDAVDYREIDYTHPTAIMLVPAEVEEGRPKIKVFGSGWQNEEAVTVEVYGPDGYHVFIGGAVADASGTFEVEIRPRSREREGGPLKPGLHGVVVLGSKNGGASATLMVTAKPDG